MAGIPKIWDKKTAFNTLDMAMRFGRATKITPLCLCCCLNCIRSKQVIAFSRKEMMELLGGEGSFSVLCRQDAFLGGIFLKVGDHERMLWEHHGQ
jgi:hypothetical protein